MESVQNAKGFLQRVWLSRNIWQVLRRPPIGLAVPPLPLLDAACIVLSLWGAYQLRFRILPYFNPVSPEFYFRLTWMTVPAWLLIFALYQLYNPEHLFGGLQEYANAVNACTVGLIGIILYGFLDRHGQEEISRGWLALVWGLSIFTVVTTRFLYRRFVYLLRKRGLFTRRVLIVGINDEGRSVAEQLRATPQAGMEVAGFLDPQGSSDSPVEGLSVWRGLHAMREAVQQANVEEIIIVPTALRREELLELYRDWAREKRLRIRLSSGLYELFTTGVQVREVGFIPLISLNRTRITGMDALMKAALDYVGAALLLVLLSPVFLIIAIVIRLDSPGPVIYRRRVVGLNGRIFDAYKFRTMIVDADAYLERHPELKKRPTAFRPPGYPLFLAGAYALFGHSYPAVRLIQALLDSVTCLLVFLIGRELFNRRVGLLAALGLSLYPLHVYMVGEFYAETVSFLLQGMALWLAARMVHRRGWPYPFLIGLFAAATALTRPTATLWVPLMAGWVVLFPQRWKERLRNLALVALGLLLLFGPWTLRNYRVFRAFIPVASLGGVGVWAGNNPLSQGGGMLPDERTWGEGAPEWGWMGWANLSEVESSQRFLERGLQWIRENPLDFALLVPKKLLRLWSPTSFGVQFSRRASPLLTAVVLPPYLVFLGVAFAGMYRTRREWWEQFPLYSVILGVNALVALTYGATRYGIAFASVLCLYAAAALLRPHEG